MNFSEENELENIKKILTQGMLLLGNWKQSIFTEQPHTHKSKKGKGRRH
jgi:hypothetical protein